MIDSVTGADEPAPVTASLAGEDGDKNDAPQQSEQPLEKAGNPDVPGEKLGRNSEIEIEPAGGEIQQSVIVASGRNYNWSLTPDTLTDYRVMKYKQSRYFKSRSTYENGEKHDKHICAVAPVYETRNSHKAKAASAAFARQRKSTAGRTRKR